jgi:peptidyl-prolyl cis-trans isomerase SurA
MELMKIRAILVAVAALAWASLPAFSQTFNGIAAIVNDSIITVNDVKEMALPVFESVQRQYFDRPQVLNQKMEEAARDGLNQLIERQLIMREFEAGGYNFPEAIIEDEIKDRIRKRFGDRVTLTQTLKAQGVTYESYRKQIREEIIINAMRSRNISQELIISPFKIESFYKTNQSQFAVGDQVKLRMIQLKPPADGNRERIRKTAADILAKAKSGTPFAELAKTYHQGTQPAGDWGWVEKNVLRKELSDVAFSLKPGQCSDPIETTDSLYLLSVEDKRQASTRPLTEVRSEIEKTLLVQERARLGKKWIDRLRKKTYVAMF